MVRRNRRGARCSPLRGSAITGFQAAPRPMAMATCYHSLLSLLLSLSLSLAPSWLLLSPSTAACFPFLLSFALFLQSLSLSLPLSLSLSLRVLPPHDNAGQTFRFSLSHLWQKADFDRNTRSRLLRRGVNRRLFPGLWPIPDCLPDLPVSG